MLRQEERNKEVAMLRESLQMIQDQIDNVREEVDVAKMELAEVRRGVEGNAMEVGYLMGWDIWLRECWNSRSSLRHVMHPAGPAPAQSSSSSSSTWHLVAPTDVEDVV